VIVGRGHVLDLEESEEVCSIAFRVCNSLAQVFGISIRQLLPTRITGSRLHI